jgi:DNA invertase Pin-like site-specific DNA recombinase
MSVPLEPPLAPRNGAAPRVLAVCRTSTAREGRRDLAGQEGRLRRYVERHYDGPVRLDVVADRGAAGRLGPEGTAAVRAAVESGELDLLVCDDLTRLGRHGHATPPPSASRPGATAHG